MDCSSILDRVCDDAYKIHFTAIAESKELLQDKGGPNPNVALREYIKSLAQIYKNATGKKVKRRYPPHKYKFFQFMKYCLEIIDLKAIWSDDGLDSSIKLTLNLP